MKIKLTFLILFVTSAGALFSQYKKIPFDTSFFWSQTSVSLPSASVSGCSYQYQIKYQKDTLIQGWLYGKFSQFAGTTGIGPCGPSFILTGFLRQDTVLKRVTLLDNNFIERPLYNFAKMVGDTMQIYQKNINANITVTVSSIDSVQFTDGTYHRRQSVFASGQYNDSFIQGTGAYFGGLFAQYNMVSSREFQVFNCYGKTSPNFTVLQNPGASSCKIIPVGIAERSYQDIHQLVPNPSSGRFEIRSAQNNLNAVKIYDGLGRLVYSEEKINSNAKELDLSNQPDGLYYLVIDFSTHSEYAKIIKK